MTEPSGYVLETLWEDAEFVLSRVVGDAEQPPLLVVAPASAQPSPESLTRLEHAYALRDELGPAWAARPLSLLRDRGRPMLLSRTIAWSPETSSTSSLGSGTPLSVLRRWAKTPCGWRWSRTRTWC